jgi:hypothetical protein
MPLMYRRATLLMEWCLECHRDPERYVVPRELVFSPSPVASDSSKVSAADLIEQYHVQSKTNCSVCHR